MATTRFVPGWWPFFSELELKGAGCAFCYPLFLSRNMIGYQMVTGTLSSVYLEFGKIGDLSLSHLLFIYSM